MSEDDDPPAKPAQEEKILTLNDDEFWSEPDMSEDD
jgi:hypothetical protein